MSISEFYVTFLSGDFMVRDFLSNVIQVGDFLSGDFVSGDCLTWIYFPISASLYACFFFSFVGHFRSYLPLDKPYLLIFHRLNFNISNEILVYLVNYFKAFREPHFLP